MKKKQFLIVTTKSYKYFHNALFQEFIHFKMEGQIKHIIRNFVRIGFKPSIRLKIAK